MSEGTWRRRELIVQLDDEEYRDVYAWDMLSVAASHGDFSLVTEIIKDGHVDIKGYYGTEALLSAIDSEHWSVMIKLLESGANPHLEGYANVTSLEEIEYLEEERPGFKFPDEVDELLEQYNYDDLRTLVQDLHDKYKMLKGMKPTKSATVKKMLPKPPLSKSSLETGEEGDRSQGGGKKNNNKKRNSRKINKQSKKKISKKKKSKYGNVKPGQTVTLKNGACAKKMKNGQFRFIKKQSCKK